MELRHLRYFHAVAEELHFRRAAERLHIAQPPLSQQIRKLEDEMGVELFARNKRRVELTTAGRVFLEHARLILSQADSAVLAAQRAGRGEVGPLTLTVEPIAAHTCLNRILPQYRARYPEVDIRLEEVLMDDAVRAVEQGAAHIALTLPYFFSEFLEKKTLLASPLVAVLSRSHLLARREAVYMKELAVERFILFPHRRGSGYSEHITGLCQQAGFTPKVVGEVERLSTLLAMVAAGYGISILPQDLPEGMGGRRPACVKLKKPEPTVEICAAWKSNEDSPLVPAFLQVARSCFS